MAGSPSAPRTHARTYEGIGPAAIVHRKRLAAIEQLLGRIEVGSSGEVADFGCSDGFILSVLQERILSGPGWSFHGFDHSERLLEVARGRNLPRTTFGRLNLNEGPVDELRQFDVVTCFETLEHVGDYRNALRCLVASCRPGGWLVMSVPNEIGVPGLVKYAGRRILRRRAYGDFFASHRESSYVTALLAGRPIEPFRQPPRNSWGPHLGFDWRRLVAFVDDEFATPDGLRLEHRSTAALGFGYLFAFRRLPAAPQPSM